MKPPVLGVQPSISKTLGHIPNPPIHSIPQSCETSRSNLRYVQRNRITDTNGYIQSNKFFVRPKTNLNPNSSSTGADGFESGQGVGGVLRKPNKDILDHDRKRQIQLKLVVLEDKLADQGYTESEIAEKIDEARKTLEAALASEEAGGASAIVLSSDAK